MALNTQQVKQILYLLNPVHKEVFGHNLSDEDDFDDLVSHCIEVGTIRRAVSNYLFEIYDHSYREYNNIKEVTNYAWVCQQETFFTNQLR